MQVELWIQWYSTGCRQTATPVDYSIFFVNPASSMAAKQCNWQIHCTPILQTPVSPELADPKHLVLIAEPMLCSNRTVDA
jgi:hypothetical protein